MTPIRRYYGHRRHPAAPCMGAVERHTEIVEGECGRVAARVIDGRRYEYSYEGAGRLIAFTDCQKPQNSATYKYDHAGNRIKMETGAGTSSAVTYHFIYEANDATLEYKDVGSDGTIERTRIYWTLPDIDQRVGFIDLVEGQDPKFYFYLCDQVGSVMQVVDEGGVVMNQYDYDAFGNLIEANSFETVENRYRFQGREWDAHAGHYYFRYRTYFSEAGCFTGPDPLVKKKDSNGLCNYLFPGLTRITGNEGNNALIAIDPDGRGFTDWVKKKAQKVADWAAATVETAGQAALSAAATVVDNAFAGEPIRLSRRTIGFDPRSPEQPWHVRLGAATGDAASVVGGIAEMLLGKTVAGGSAFVTVKTGGLSSPITVPGIKVGVIVGVHGGSVTGLGAWNLGKSTIALFCDGRGEGRPPQRPTWVFGKHKSAAKWGNQMRKRGWTPEQISEAMDRGARFSAENLVNKGNSATRHVHPETGRSVVVDDITKEVLHVGGDGFRY